VLKLHGTTPRIQPKNKQKQSVPFDRTLTKTEMYMAPSTVDVWLAELGT